MVVGLGKGIEGGVRSQNAASCSKDGEVDVNAKKIIQNVNDRFEGLFTELKKLWGIDAVKIEGAFTVDDGFQGTLTLKDGFHFTKMSLPSGERQEDSVLPPSNVASEKQRRLSSIRHAGFEEEDDIFWQSDDESSLASRRPSTNGVHRHLPADHPLDDPSEDEAQVEPAEPVATAPQPPAKELQTLSIQASTSTTVDLNDESSVVEFVTKRCYRVGQNAMKQINMDIISHIQPKKQASHAYKRGVVPGWWPQNVQYKEPSHVSKEERTAFFLDVILLYRRNIIWQHLQDHARSKASSGRTDRDFGWTHFLQQATQHSKLHNVSAEREVEETRRKREALDQVWTVLQLYEEVYHDERDPHIMHLTDQPKNRSGRPPKPQGKKAAAKTKTAASAKTPARQRRQGTSLKRPRASEADSGSANGSSSGRRTRTATRAGPSQSRKSSVTGSQELVYVYEQPQNAHNQGRTKSRRVGSNKKSFVEHEETSTNSPDSTEASTEVPAPEPQPIVEAPIQVHDNNSDDGSVFCLASPEPERNPGDTDEDMAYEDDSPVDSQPFQSAQPTVATQPQSFPDSAGPSWNPNFAPPPTAMSQYPNDYIDYSRPFQQNDSFTSSASQQHDQSWPASPMQYNVQNVPNPHFAPFPHVMPATESPMVSPVYQYSPQMVPQNMTMPGPPMASQPPHLNPFYATTHLPHGQQMHPSSHPAMNFPVSGEWYNNPHNMPGTHEAKYSTG